MFNLNLCLSLFLSLAVDSAFTESCQDPATDPDNIHRPCPDFDLDCIRNFFVAHSKCQLALGPSQNPLFVKHYSIDFVVANVTTEMIDAYIGHSKEEIVEFYVNYETLRLVLALEVHNLTTESEVVYKFNRKKKEPIIGRDYGKFNYGTVTYTIVFHNFMNLTLSRADVSTYIERSRPDYTIGPGLVPSADSPARRQFETLFNVHNLPVDVREASLMQGTIYMFNYIQDNICDFGLNLTTENNVRKNDKEPLSN